MYKELPTEQKVREMLIDKLKKVNKEQKKDTNPNPPKKKILKTENIKTNVKSEKNNRMKMNKKEDSSEDSNDLTNYNKNKNKSKKGKNKRKYFSEKNVISTFSNNYINTENKLTNKKSKFANALKSENSSKFIKKEKILIIQ